jgi:hypothetical protein
MRIGPYLSERQHRRKRARPDDPALLHDAPMRQPFGNLGKDLGKQRRGGGAALIGPEE